MDMRAGSYTEIGIRSWPQVCEALVFSVYGCLRAQTGIWMGLLETPSWTAYYVSE
jgi:hypothetical protein